MAKESGARRPYGKVDKSLGIQVIELIRALQIIHDSISGLRHGRSQYLIPLAGQLRALLTDKSKGIEPLLLRLANKFQKPLMLHCMPGIDDPEFPEGLRDRIEMRMAGFPLSPQKQLPAQSQVTFEHFLGKEILLYKGNNYSAKKLIEWFANKAGGAHYSEDMPEDFAALLTLDLMGMKPIANALLQIGEAALFCGRNLLKSLVDFDIHALLAIPPQHTPKLTFLFDQRYEDSSMQLTVSVDHLLVPRFTVSGLQGTKLAVQADRLVDWNTPRHLQATLRIAEDLSTVIELAIDGDSVGIARVDEPLFVLSDPLNYEMYLHRSVEGAVQQTTIGIAEMLMIGRDISSSDRANLHVYFEDKRKKPDLLLCVYAPGSYGHAAKGTKDLAMTGDVKRMVVEEFLGGGREPA